MRRLDVYKSARAASFLAAAAVACLAPIAVAAVSFEQIGGDQFRVTFTYAAPPDTKTVHVAGGFNDWSMTATSMSGPDGKGVFRIELVLPGGQHEYKFVRNGSVWELDPDNPEQVAPHSNAVLRLGGGGRAAGATNPMNLARRAEHPTDFVEYLRSWPRQTSFWCFGPPANVRAYLSVTMPWLTGDTVSFKLEDADAHDPHISIAGHGFRTGYSMDRWPERSGVYVLTLRRSDVPPGVVYTIEYEKNSKTCRIVDPFAWTHTSRSGQAVSVVAGANSSHGRIVVLSIPKSTEMPMSARDLYVYVPPDYDPCALDPYPVLYMHDGQNIWDDPTEPFGHGGWKVNVTADRIMAEGKVRPFIVVGIPNSPERMKEYGPGRSIFDDSDQAYLQFVLRDVKPLIDQRFHTSTKPADTAIMGSSMGGIISLQAALLHPDVFGAVGCLSPAFAFADGDGKTYADLIERVGKRPVRLYIDHGTAGPHEDGAAATKKIVALITKTGWVEGHDLQYFVDEGAQHNERAWRARLDRPLLFLFGRSAAVDTHP